MMDTSNITYDNLKDTILNKDFKFFDKGKYNVNIIGIRSKDAIVNEFNDIICLAYLDDFGDKVVLKFKATTKPGLYYLKNKLGNINGTAILIPGQYARCWKHGLHSGYEALRQRGTGIFKVWRDNDSDSELDTDGKVYNDVGGLNCHTTSFRSEIEKVGAYSAGCQVIQNDNEFLSFMSILDRSSENYGSTFTYTLLEETDLK